MKEGNCYAMQSAIKGLVAALSIGMSVVVSSCSSNDDIEPVNPAKSKFQAAFNEQFGAIDSKVNWGFNEVVVDDKQADIVKITRAASPNGLNNLGKLGISAPAAITVSEAQQVRAWFAANQNPTSETIVARNFFVQQVYVSDKGARIKNLYAGYGINKNGKHEKKDDKITPFDVTDFGYVQLMLNSGTDKFSFDCGKDKHVYNYCIHSMVVDGELGYYVGFDFEDSNTSADGYYDDLIIKITRVDDGSETPIPSRGRIIVEDLGSIGDFDYNDAVFDAYVYYGTDGTYADIVVLAAGARNNIYVAGNELHELFGVEPGTMVNTRNGIDEVPVKFTIKVSNDKPKTFDFNNIEVKTDNAVLTSQRGVAPEKICVGVDYDWCDERENIIWRYPNFKKYVSGAIDSDWWK